MNLPPEEHGYYPADTKGVRSVSRVVIAFLILIVVLGVVFFLSGGQTEQGSLSGALCVGFVGTLALATLSKITHKRFGRQITQKYLTKTSQDEEQPGRKTFLVGEDAYNKRMSKRKSATETAKWQHYIPPE